MKNINFQRSRMSHSLHGLVLPLVLSLVLTGAGCGSKTKVTESDLSATTNRGVTSNELPAPTSSVRSTAQEVSVTCDDKVNRRAKLICDLLKSNDHDAQTESLPPLEVIYRNIDLNADGKNEIVAWESSWSGTSGGMLWFLEESDAGMRIVSEIEMTWTPIILLTSENNKWRDIAYLSTGTQC